MRLDSKQKLWIALSDLFLDTDVRLFFDHIIDEMAASGFTDEEVKCICMEEVAPALAFNLFDIAGEWCGFDQGWLIERIEHMQSLGLRRFLNAMATKRYVDKVWKELLNYRAEKESISYDDE